MPQLILQPRRTKVADNSGLGFEIGTYSPFTPISRACSVCRSPGHSSTSCPISRAATDLRHTHALISFHTLYTHKVTNLFMLCQF